MRPFKPLTIRKTEFEEPPANFEPAPKRRKLSPPGSAASSSSTYAAAPTAPAAKPREPLKPIANPASPPKASLPGSIASHYTVLWRNPSTKKNKSWTGDGVLSVSNGFATFCDNTGKTLGRCTYSDPLLPGSEIKIGGKEVEIDASITRDEFMSIIQPKRKPKPTAVTKSASAPPKKPASSLQNQLKAAIKKEKDRPPLAIEPIQAAYKPPVKGSSKLFFPEDVPTPRHDPEAAGAVVFQRLKKVAAGKQVVDVVLDPALSKRLHEHQKIGVKFLYECVMGIRKDSTGQGCILADDMGLGKTVQTISLLWTLIKQNPIWKDAPVIKKALIVCPVSVIQNWKKEFKKWLSHTNIGVLVFEDPKTTRLRMFDGKVYNVMIIGYERLRTVADELADQHDIDIVICDEGHRLKTEKNKSAKAIQSLNTARRVVLSGTPIQNDLSEFFVMVNFVNDGCLGTAKAFARDFENPIMKARQPHATSDAIEKGGEATQELSRTTSPFILRRTADILSDILPTKTEYVLFCKPTSEQAEVYRQVVNSAMFTSALGSTDAALQLITILKKLCNSPSLLQPKFEQSSSLTTLNQMLPESIARKYRNTFSAKIRLLDVLLQQIRSTTDEKIVLVSNYTSTLNLMASLLDNSNMKYLRLEGSVMANKRQALVDQFNRTPADKYFAFLLSAKAGGVGINLIGASRLVLFDVDWNPATDDQAIARIHRQGQKLPTHIYRFLIKGGIEERIWQRQVVKRGLADSIMEGRDVEGGKSKGKGAAFSQDELRDLFRFDETHGLKTHNLIDCRCGGNVYEEPTVADIDSFEGALSARSLTPELPDFKDIVPASQLDTERDGTVSPRKGSPHTKRQGINAEELMKYKHFDTSSVLGMTEGEELEKMQLLIDEPCLSHLLQQDEDTVASSVAWVFKRVWGVHKVDGDGEIVVKEEDVKSGFFG